MDSAINFVLFMAIFCLSAAEASFDQKNCYKYKKSYSEDDVWQNLTLDGDEMYRPVLHADQYVDVKIRLKITSILDFNVALARLSMTGQMTLTWDNDLIEWDRDESCIDQISVPARNLWVPEISIDNAIDGNGRSFLNPANQRLVLYWNGDVTYSPTGQLSVKCFPNIEYYPLDEQVCSISIRNRGYDDSHMNLTFDRSRGSPFEIDYDANGQWVDHPLWDIVETRFHEFYIADSGDCYRNLQFLLKLRRKSLYYFVNILTPGSVIAAILFVVYALPVDSVAKFGFAFTCLFAYSVFNSMILGDIPRSSRQVPIILVYIYAQMACITVIVIGGQALVFYILSRSKAKGSKPPSWLLRVLCCCGADPKAESDEDDPKKEAEEEAKEQWIAVARLASRVGLVLYVIAIVVIPLVVLVGTAKPTKIDLQPNVGCYRKFMSNWQSKFGDYAI